MEDVEWEPGTPESIAPLLEMADRILAERQIPISERPLAALIQLVQWEMIAGSDGQHIPLDGSKIAESEAFRPLGKMIGAWYRDQYGRPSLTAGEREIYGFVLIRMSPFLIEIPTNIAEPGGEPDTAWLRFTDHVEASEDVLDWLTASPNPHSFPDLDSVKQDITEVGNDLRFIYTASLGVMTGKDEQLLAFIRAVMTHLNRAAQLVSNQRTQEVVESYWEMQMAAEVALKALLLQRTGKFPFIHTLGVLVKDVQEIDCSFPSDPLGEFPNDKETIKRRYGTGRASWEETYGHYRLILKLIRATLERIKRVRLGGASICIRKAPWAG